MTLGVRDLERSLTFYRGLGWEPDRIVEGTVFFQAGAIVVALWDRELLAEDSVAVDSGGWGGITLAHNVSTPAEVDSILDSIEDAGGQVRRRGAPTEWGGYSGVFTDPDGHAWEIAHNPFWRVTEEGATLLD